MKNRKTLKAKIISSYIYISIPLSIVAFAIIVILSYLIQQNEVKNYENLVDQTFQNNLRLGNSTYFKDNKFLVINETKRIAYALSGLIHNNKISSIDNNLVDMLIGTEKNRKNFISSFAILNQKGDIVFDSDNKSVVGNNYRIFKKEFPDVYSYIKTALTRNEFYGTYMYKTSEQKNLFDKCSASIRIANTPYFVFTSHYQSHFSKDLYSDLSKEKEKNLKTLDTRAQTYFWKTFWHTIIITFVIILVFLVTTCVIGSKLAHWISFPLVQIQNGLKEFGKGNFLDEVPVSGCLETVTLVNAFNKLGQDLDTYMVKLEDEITTRNTIENEIRIAQNIQKSILPQVTDEFNNENFSLYSRLVPAKEVAGDFYDFFFIDKEKTKLGFLIADVSGKSISAAFFMCIVKTITKSFCISGIYEPKDVLNKTNEFISKDNSEYMFTTMFLGFYDLKTGDLTYANAGHHSTIHITKNQTIEEFGVFKNRVLCIDSDYKYSSGQKHIDHGEKLILYTDGITDAVSPDNKDYGVERLRKVLINNISSSPEIICNEVINNVRKFQNDILFDDITVLVFHRK